MEVTKKTLSLFAAGGMALTFFSCPQNPDSVVPDGSQGGNGSSAKPADKMNIILFMVDDMGLNDTQVPFLDGGSTLNKYYYTPNMLRLAEKGVRFTSAYASPVSSPTRVSLMTGSNAARHRVTNWTLNMNSNTDSFGSNNALTSQNWNFNGISPDLAADATQDNIYESTCFPEVLRKNGYRTIHLGKAHWGAVGTLAAEPLNLGFDVNIGGCAAGGLASYTIANEDANYSFGANGNIPFPLINQYAEKESNYHITDAITKAAKSEIDRAIEDETPFYMYMSHYAVHSPYQEDSRFIDLYGSGNQTTRNYGTLITGMDRSLGQLMDYLEEKKIADKTIIIFMADNGGHHWNKNTPLKGSKGSLWEGGIHEPMMVYWPGVTDAYAGQTNDSPVIIEDFYPTILEMAGIERTAYESSLKQIVDGQSFVSALRGNKLINTERPLIFHYPNRWGEATALDGNPIGEPSSAIIEGGWKYIYFYHNNSEFLYNLNNDETEQTNLAVSESAKKEEMAKKLSDYLKSVDATMVYNKTTRQAVYPDQSTKDMTAVYSPDADGVLYLDFGNQRSTVETIPAVGLGNDSTKLSGTDSRKIRFDESAEGTLDVSFSGTIKPNGDKGCFASVDEANAFGTLFSGFTKETALTTKYQAVWGDAVTLESDSPRITVTFRGMPAGEYELKLLSVRNNNWYGSTGIKKITNAVYEITTGTVSGTPAAVGMKQTTAEDVSSKAVPGDGGRFTINQDGLDTEVWGFCLAWEVAPVDGTIVLDISGVCAVTALRLEKK